MFDNAIKSVVFIAGMICGGLFLAVAVFSGHTKVITSDFSCTKTEVIGTAPNRYEACIKYERKAG